MAGRTQVVQGKSGKAVPAPTVEEIIAELVAQSDPQGYTSQELSMMVQQSQCWVTRNWLRTKYFEYCGMKQVPTINPNRQIRVACYRITPLGRGRLGQNNQ